MWADAGRVQTMLRLSKVYARTLDSQSRIGDDADDRDRHFYVKQALVDVAPGEIRQAWMVDHEEYPFAFEFLNRVRFREVNFGEQSGDGQPITIAGEEANPTGLCAVRRVRDGAAQSQPGQRMAQPHAVLLEAQAAGHHRAGMRVPVSGVRE
jgi:hypothetical protein